MHFHSELFDHFYSVTIGTDYHQTCHKMRVKDKRTATDTVKGLMLDLQSSFSGGETGINPPPPSYVRGLIEVYRVYDVLLRGPTFVYSLNNYRPTYIAKPL